MNRFNGIYIHSNLFSHIIGQVDYDNFGVSGVEKYLDKELKDKDLANKPLELTLDANIQYLISKELKSSLVTFDATGGGALLMNVENGEILSLVSLPDFDINERTTIKEKNILIKLPRGFMNLAQFLKLLL